MPLFLADSAKSLPAKTQDEYLHRLDEFIHQYVKPFANALLGDVEKIIQVQTDLGQLEDDLRINFGAGCIDNILTTIVDLSQTLADKEIGRAHV